MLAHGLEARQPCIERARGVQQSVQFMSLAELPTALDEVSLEELLQGLLQEQTRTRTIAGFQEQVHPLPVASGEGSPLARDVQALLFAHSSTPDSRISRTNGSPARRRRSSSSGVSTIGETGKPMLRSRIVARASAIRW